MNNQIIDVPPRDIIKSALFFTNQVHALTDGRISLGKNANPKIVLCQAILEFFYASQLQQPRHTYLQLIADNFQINYKSYFPGDENRLIAEIHKYILDGNGMTPTQCNINHEVETTKYVAALEAWKPDLRYHPFESVISTAAKRLSLLGRPTNVEVDRLVTDAIIKATKWNILLNDMKQYFNNDITLAYHPDTSIIRREVLALFLGQSNPSRIKYYARLRPNNVCFAGDANSISFIRSTEESSRFLSLQPFRPNMNIVDIASPGFIATLDLQHEAPPVPMQFVDPYELTFEEEEQLRFALDENDEYRDVVVAITSQHVFDKIIEHNKIFAKKMKSVRKKARTAAREQQQLQPTQSKGPIAGQLTIPLQQPTPKKPRRPKAPVQQPTPPTQPKAAKKITPPPQPKAAKQSPPPQPKAAKQPPPQPKAAKQSPPPTQPKAAKKTTPLPQPKAAKQPPPQPKAAKQSPPPTQPKAATQPTPPPQPKAAKQPPPQPKAAKQSPPPPQPKAAKQSPPPPQPKAAKQPTPPPQPQAAKQSPPAPQPEAAKQSPPPTQPKAATQPTPPPQPQAAKQSPPAPQPEAAKQSPPTQPEDAKQSPTPTPPTAAFEKHLAPTTQQSVQNISKVTQITLPMISSSELHENEFVPAKYYTQISFDLTDAHLLFNTNGSKLTPSLLVSSVKTHNFIHIKVLERIPGLVIDYIGSDDCIVYECPMLGAIPIHSYTEIHIPVFQVSTQSPDFSSPDSAIRFYIMNLNNSPDCIINEQTAALLNYKFK